MAFPDYIGVDTCNTHTHFKSSFYGRGMVVPADHDGPLQHVEDVQNGKCQQLNGDLNAGVSTKHVFSCHHR